MRNRWIHLMSALALIACAQAASAQPVPAAPQHAASARAVFNPYPAISPSPNSPSQYAARSPLSPYLNLLRGGDPAANYYLDVVPLLQKQKKDLEPANVPPRIDPKLEEEFKEINLRRSTSGNLSSFGNYYGAYALPNRGYIPYAPPAMGRPPVGP
jgi:hypothetical protein